MMVASNRGTDVGESGAAPDSVAGLARAHANQAQTPAQSLDRVLARIDRLDPELAAWQVVYADEAKVAAEAATGAIASDHRTGPFHGVPFALKDIVDLEGRVTTAGSAAMIDRVSPATATIARRLMAAGGVLVGKTKTVEIALGGWGQNEHFGMPRNPWDADDERAPGGSSSGSGVAVASGMVPCAIGTDTGGSVRLPASFCGIVGLKTTEGLLPTDGIVPLSHTLDTPGPMARSVEDVMLMFDVLTGRNPIEIDDDWQHRRGLYRELDRGISGLRLGAIGPQERDLVDDDVLVTYDRALEQLGDLGAEISVFETPLSFEHMKDMTFVIVTAEGWHHHGHLIGDPEASIGAAVRSRAIVGRDISAARYIDAQLQRRQDQAQFNDALGSLDALITPTTPTVAPIASELDPTQTPAHFTRAGNYLGLCGLSIPAGLASDASSAAAGGVLPVGLQILGRSRAEAGVLRIGAAFERARGPMPPPPLGAWD